MKALSVRQPWAWLIANGYKDVENRTWLTKYRGPVLIHAATKETPGHWQAAAEIQWRAGCRYVPMTYDKGGIVGVATIVDCITASDSPWFFGPYAFTLKDAAPLPFIPCPGKLGFFDVSAEVERQALAALAAVGHPLPQEGAAPANPE